ncbi:hypothetical protein B484DRAFT_478169 [Ochromonadaceae sp. CCMP2298]|nr:hypothetical protein B484DRAFT_478169 [Ochromonadaceae sp. CCMP2298]
MSQVSSYNAVSSVEAAAAEAAVADGLVSSVYGKDDNAKARKASLRRGKWTTEEEYYANRLIYEFKLGLLPLTDGTTLRTFLSKLLNCDPMRISKKFVGQNCIGKQVFRRRQQDLEKLTQEQIELSRKELAELERKFMERVAQTNRTKSAGGGVKSLKDGKMDYEDEHGNAILAPWMIPPDEAPPKGAPPPNSNGQVGPDSRLGFQQLSRQNYQGQQQHPFGFIHSAAGGPVMLVNMGILPQPEQNVLSNSVWSGPPGQRPPTGAGGGAGPITAELSPGKGAGGGGGGGGGGGQGGGQGGEEGEQSFKRELSNGQKLNETGQLSSGDVHVNKRLKT